MPEAHEVIGTIIPHSDFGDPDCCGCLNAIIRGDRAEITCNECGKVVRTVPAASVRKVFEEMQSSLDAAQAWCASCGAVQTGPGFSELHAFICDNCGASVEVKTN